MRPLTNRGRKRRNEAVKRVNADEADLKFSAERGLIKTRGDTPLCFLGGGISECFEFRLSGIAEKEPGVKTAL